MNGQSRLFFSENCESPKANEVCRFVIFYLQTIENARKVIIVNPFCAAVLLNPYMYVFKHSFFLASELSDHKTHCIQAVLWKQTFSRLYTCLNAQYLNFWKRLILQCYSSHCLCVSSDYYYRSSIDWLIELVFGQFYWK